MSAGSRSRNGRRPGAVTKQLVRWLLARLGYRLVRVRETARNAVRPPYYEFPRSCQITGLGELYALLLGERAAGMVVEVGAHDGITHSNTSGLIDRGWSAVLVEPVPAFAQQCRQRYAGRDDVRVVQAACGAEPARMTIHVASGLSTLDEAQLDEYLNRDWSRHVVAQAAPADVEVRTLDSVLVECGVQPGFDVLVVDVEGFESQVLDGFDVQRWCPQLMIWELQDTSAAHDLHRQDSIDIADQLCAAGYRIVFKDPVNTVFHRRRHLDGARIPTQ